MMNWYSAAEQLAHQYAHLSVDDWWEIDNPYEKSWGCVLVQHTTWHNATLALDSLRENGMAHVSGMLAANREQLERVIRSAGFYRAKAATLKSLAAWWERKGGLEGAMGDRTEQLRRELLNIRGIGKETADTLLLYVFARRTFIGDTYTRRFVSRITGQKPGTYDDIREDVLATEMNVECLQRFHAYIVQFGKHVCRKRSPHCQSCPFSGHCDYGQTV